MSRYVRVATAQGRREVRASPARNERVGWRRWAPAARRIPPPVLTPDPRSLVDIWGGPLLKASQPPRQRQAKLTWLDRVKVDILHPARRLTRKA